jgi:two-component system response regulator
MEHSSRQPPLDILLVEDNPGDARLLREALQLTTGYQLSLQIAEDGEKAMEYLRGSSNQRPSVIFLDLNLPKKDGREVLAEIKADPELKRIPVIVLTTSEAERDIQKAYELQANCYIHKPSDFDEYTEMVQSCEKFWFHIVRLPASLSSRS